MSKGFKLFLLLLIMVGLTTMGVPAYFTDKEDTVNTFTVGKVSIKVEEPSWEEPTDVTPLKEYPKDPMVVNDGDGDVYVFLEVVVPYSNVNTYDDNGVSLGKNDTQLFTWEIRNGWSQVGIESKDTTNKTLSYLYAYMGTKQGMDTLSANEVSGSLFNSVKFANMEDINELDNISLDIIINAYAIQSSSLFEGVEVVSPTDVLSVIVNEKVGKEGNLSNYL